jgi:hypothetical protein
VKRTICRTLDRIVDDYHVVATCQHAVPDFLAQRALEPDLLEIDGSGVCWRKM